MHLLFGLALVAAATSRSALAQTTPSTTVAPGVPINANNPTAPVMNSGTIVPGQAVATPPVATPSGAVYSAPSTKKKPTYNRSAKPSKTNHPAL